MAKVQRCNRHRSFRGPGMVVEFCLLLALAAYPGRIVAASKPDFGPNVLIFNPSMPAAAIQDQINKVYDIQKNSEFGSARNALLFLPGTYNVDVPVGYYTQVLGLGAGRAFVDFFQVNKMSGEPKGILAIRLGRSRRK